MTERNDVTQPAPPLGSTDPAGGLLTLGLVFVLAGVVAGIVLAVRSQPAGCDSGTGDPCSHPSLALGLILIFASLFGGILLGLVAMTARRVLAALPAPVPSRARTPAGPSGETAPPTTN